MAKFSYVDGWDKIICEDNTLEDFWKKFIKTKNFHYDIISYLWECLVNYDGIKNKFPTMNYLYPFVKEYADKMSKIDMDYTEGIEEFEKIDKIIEDIITTICKNDNDCRDLIIKDFSEFKVD